MLAAGVGGVVHATHAPGPAVVSTNPETVPLKTDDVVVPLVLTTTMKLADAGTMKE